jgi:hypothetical protein
MALNLGDLFGKESAFGQIMIWGVGQQVIGAVLAPGLTELTHLVNEIAQTEVLAPADLADLVVRNYMDMDTATSVAKKSGVSPDDFALLVRNAGDAPDTTTLIEAFRRRIIGWDSSSGALPSVLDGIREGRLADKWAPMLQALGDVPIGVADAVDAVVEGQISRAAGEEIAYQNGISAANFAILYNTRGNPPAPSELAEMVRRGIIPQGGTGPDVLSMTQGISEGATKDKWIPALEKLLTVLPPEGRVTAMLRAGAITRDQAIGYYKALGYDDTVAAGFAAEASHTKTAAAKDLAKGDVEKLYADGAIDAATATSMLGGLGYAADEAAYLLAIQDLHATTVIVDAAITRIRSYYIARKIADESVVTALDSLGVPPAQRDKLIAAWKIDRTSNVKLLTEAQLVDAAALGIIGTDQASTGLIALGYTAHDAWVLLSIKNKAPLPGEPPDSPTPL